jgi:hypothetical protein
MIKEGQYVWSAANKGGKGVMNGDETSELCRFQIM